MWIYTSTPHTPSWHSASLIKHRDNFTLPFTRNYFLMQKFLFITNLTSDYNKNIFGFKQMPYLISFYFVLFIDQYFLLAQQLMAFHCHVFMCYATLFTALEGFSKAHARSYLPTQSTQLDDVI
jgi:hypothetical protein